MKYLTNKKGFTLVEMVVVIAIIGIIITIAVPRMMNFIESSRLSSDRATVRTLNSMTPVYRASLNKHDDPFLDTNYTSEELFELLVDEEYIESFVEPQANGVTFEWNIDNERWFLSHDGPFQIVGEDHGLTLNDHTIGGVYNGKYSKIKIPNNLSNQEIYEILSGVFKDKDLTEVDFGEYSKLLRIHSRAFKDNYLTSLDFPSNLKMIDSGAFQNNLLTELQFPDGLQHIGINAFQGNDITRINIGEGVKIENNAFGNKTRSFLDAYESGGPGNYVYISGEWIKQP